MKITEGAIVTAQKVNKTLSAFMSASELAATPKGTAIYQLDPEDIAALGPLNSNEEDALRPVINTKDVYPYAVVLPDDHARLLWLPQPHDLLEGMTQEQIIQQPFDDAAMPAIGKHLERFRPALTRRLVDGWRSKGDQRWVRPWWTAHQSQEHVVGHVLPGHEWGTYCLTAQRGSGGSLIVGLAPPGAVPKSGLHMMYADTDQDSRFAAYLCGIFNSDMVQQLADTMPPGHIRSSELTAIGLPNLDDDARQAIETSVYELADLMKATLSTGRLGDAYPELRTLLRDSVQLHDTPAGWCPRPGPDSTWGSMKSIKWMEVSSREGSQAKPVTSATFEETIFGPALRLLHDGATASGNLSLSIAGDHVPDIDEQQTLLAWARGLTTRGVHLRHVTDLPMPISLRLLHAQHTADKGDLDTFIDTYRSHRRDIEQQLTG